jgi:hypothetical protein
MDEAEALNELRRAYLTASSDEERLAAVLSFRGEHSAAPAEPDAGTLLPVLEALLHHASRDGPDARLVAARLLFHLWRGLSGEALDPFFHAFTLRLLESCPPHGTSERRLVRTAIMHGFAAARPARVDELCRELTEREAIRCRLPRATSGIWSGLATPPTPEIDILEIVAQYASPTVWPGLTRDLWLLYSLGADVRLPFGELLMLLRAETGVKYLRTRDARGRRVAHVAHWSLARQMLRRTLDEAQPGDLRDAETAFFAWLEALAGMPEEELEPLLPSLMRWPLPAMARVLERWAAVPMMRELLLGGPSHSRAFRRKAAGAAAAMRAALGEGAELVPAVPPHGEGSEPTPAVSPRGAESEVASTGGDASECASKRH